MQAKRQSGEAGTYIIDGWQGYVPALSGMRPGRQEFTITFEDGRFVSAVELEALAPLRPTAAAGLSDSATPEFGWLTMSQAAARCRCSLTWFSRNWKGWGLHPSRLGRLLFDETEIDTLLKDKRITRRGRPQKVRGLRA